MEMKETVKQGIEAAVQAAVREGICRQVNTRLSSWKFRRRKNSATLRLTLPCSPLARPVNHRVI